MTARKGETARKGDFIQVKGKLFYPLDARPEDIFIDDIAQSLSKLCRWGGHSSEFYSVAEHSVWVSHLVPEEHALTALLHDATEAYLVDVPRPIKPMLGNYREIEDNLWKVIAKRFGLPEKMDDSVKEADNAMLLSEQRALIGPQIVPWNITSTMEGYSPWCVDHKKAYKMFMARYKELTEQRYRLRLLSTYEHGCVFEEVRQ